MKQLAAPIFAFVLGSCAAHTVGSAEWYQAAGPYPTNYRELVRTEIRRSFKDPYSVRDATISAPQAGSNFLIGSGWFVCLRANAKNSFGAYIGQKYAIFVIANGVITSAGEGASNGATFADVNCPQASGWERFEINAQP